jgi:aspartate aminotransferase
LFLVKINISMGTLSQLSETLIGSEIVRLGNEINARIVQGETIYNFTIGDFNPEIFPIPLTLENEIIAAYQNKKTNYPSAEGILPLRESIAKYVQHFLQLNYAPNEIQVASGGRPLIYSIYRAIVDEGDKVVYPVPSWNNNHYTHFTQGIHVAIETSAENKFMPTPQELAPHIKDARLIALCSPLNPTGTTFSKTQLLEICNMVVAENERRGADEKKLFVLYDQIYGVLTHGDTQHVNPVTLNAGMRDYTIFVDGISKSFAATGVRVGWSMGPAPVIAKVKAILSHVGAWAPMAEQVACANYLKNTSDIEKYFSNFKAELSQRLFGFYEGIIALKNKGFTVDSIAPEAALYLTIKIDLVGKTKADGSVINTQLEVWQYILDEAKIAIVPFSSFGAGKNSPWYRMSIGTSKLNEMEIVLQSLEQALGKLK